MTSHLVQLVPAPAKIDEVVPLGHRVVHDVEPGESLVGPHARPHGGRHVHPVPRVHPLPVVMLVQLLWDRAVPVHAVPN